MNKQIKRDGRIYNVVDECDTDYCVECPMDFWGEETPRLMRLWWDKKYCEPVEPEPTNTPTSPRWGEPDVTEIDEVDIHVFNE